MLKKKFFNANNILFFIEILLFLCCSFFFIPCWDDLVFGYDDFFQFSNFGEFLHSVFYYGNGRLFGNAMIVLFSKIPLAFYLLDFVLILLFSIIVEELLEFKNIKFLVFSSFALMPLALFKQSVAWMCSQINYFIPIFCLALILLILKKKNGIKSKAKITLYSLVLVVLGFSEQLYIEHNAIINVVISFVIVVLWCKRKKKNKIFPTLLLISNIAGALILFFFSKVIDYNQTFVFKEADGYRYTILSAAGLKDAIFFLTNNFKFLFLIYCTSAFLYTLLISALFYISKKSEATLKHRKILFLLCMLYYPICLFCTVCYFLDVNWIVECLIAALPAALNLLAVLIMLYFCVIKRAPKMVSIKVCASLFLSVISFAPFLFVSPCSYRGCLFSYFFWLLAVLYILKFANESYGYNIDKAYKFSIIAACVVLVIYVGLFANQKEIYDYTMQYIKTSYYLPKGDEHIVCAGDSPWRFVDNSMEHEFIPFDEWKEIMGIK